MEKKFEGVVLNGFLMLFTSLALLLASIVVAISGIVMLSNETGETGGTALLVGGLIGAVVAVIMFCGFLMLEPNEARVITWFGKYAGTFTNTGYFWINPFYSVKKLSLRARNLDAKPIKVNDKVGNPVMIGLVLVWRLKDTYKAIFEIDSQTMAPANQQELGGATLKAIMQALENFVKVQSDAALRQVAGQYAYDDTDEKAHQLLGLCPRDCCRDASPPTGHRHHHCPREDCGGRRQHGEDGPRQALGREHREPRRREESRHGEQPARCPLRRRLGTACRQHRLCVTKGEETQTALYMKTCP